MVCNSKELSELLCKHACGVVIFHTYLTEKKRMRLEVYKTKTLFACLLLWAATPFSCALPSTAEPEKSAPDVPALNESSVFSIAILPDTQQEVQAANARPTDDMRFRQRMQWLVDNKEALNLRYVLHSGDVVNWGERDEHQYGVAVDAYEVLHAAGIPFMLGVGNHDTRAVCEGGGACPEENAHATLRELPRFNAHFEPLMGPHVLGRYEAGNLSNAYGRFEAGGAQWLVLSLELWPRTPVIAWAKRVVAEHPADNVILITHAFLTASGAIGANNGGYGDTSPQYLYDNLIKLYPNIRFVFSGHSGEALSRSLAGVNGNKVLASLQAFHSDTNNPVRLMEIDTSKNTATTYIFAPKTSERWTQYDDEASGMDFIQKTKAAKP